MLLKPSVIREPKREPAGRIATGSRFIYREDVHGMPAKHVRFA